MSEWDTGYYEDEPDGFGGGVDPDDELDDFDDEQEGIDELEEAMMNCGMTRDGTCLKAGSEECDWECPFSE